MSNETPVPPEPGAQAVQPPAGDTNAVVPAVSPADMSPVPPHDARGSLTKAYRALARCLPSDTPDRAALLLAVQSAIDRLARSADYRVCRRCQQPFVFTVALQEDFAARGWPPPRHCRSCREARARERAQTGAAHLVPPE